MKPRTGRAYFRDAAAIRLEVLPPQKRPAQDASPSLPAWLVAAIADLKKNPRRR